MHEIRTQKKWLKALGALYQLFVELVIRAGSTFNTLWVVICLLLAGVAIYNFSHLNSLKEETSKRRLLEASAQDLLMQSITLRHVSSNLQDNENNAERLRRFGYASQAEVFTQLDSRLQLVTTLSANSEFDDWAKRLSTTLTDIEQKANAENTSPAELSQSIDEWFITLSALNSYIRHQALEQEEDASLLQRHNLLLAIAVLAYSLFLGAFHIWMSKRQQSQFHFEVSSLYDETRKDPLTGLLNRRGWLHFTHYTLKRIAKFGSTPVAVAILDIDYFKQYNDTYGHDAGDLRLVEFAEMIRGNFRPSDTVARVGGEEFAVLLPNCTVEDAKRIIDRIREIKQNNISFSAGVADLEECKTVEGAMAVADQALYQAKTGGRNRVSISHPA